MFFSSIAAFFSKIFCFTGYVNNKSSFPRPLTQEEEHNFLVRAKEGDGLAREMLIRHNLRLVAHIVKKYQNAGETDDLISVGSIGLIKGIESFELDKGNGLVTYAAKCIENEILMHIRSSKKHKCTVSLQESVGIDKEGNEITLMDIIPMKDDSIFKKVEASVAWNRVLQLIETCLSPRERIIIKKRYGVDGSGKTQLEVAKEMNISRSYVSRIEKKAISKIAKAMNKPT